MAVDINKLLDRYTHLKSQRDGLWLNVWREVRQYVMPTYSDYLTEGGSRGENLFDTTAIEARKRLAAGMYNWMAPPDKRWFDLVPVDEGLSKDESVKDYFAEVTKTLAFSLANSNWPSVLIQLLNNLACGMDAVCYCEEGGEDKTLHFKSFPIESICYCEDAYGKVDTVFREVTMTSRQILREFSGKDDHVPEKIRAEGLDPKHQETKHKLLQIVLPRPDRDCTLMDNKNMAYADLYVDMETRTVVHEAGYEEFPFAVVRFDKSDNECYGRGPGLDKLPDIKMLNRMRQSYILISEHQADPSWMAPDGSIVGPEFNRDPGSMNFYKPDMSGLKPEPVPVVAHMGQLYQDIEAEREKIKQGFFWDIFDPLGDLRQITATEAEIRNEGKMIPFAPIAGNLHSELFRVVIHRVYGLCMRRGILPPMPSKLAEKPDYKIEFVSKIALSIKKLESLGWLQTEAALQAMAAVKPEIMDNFDMDTIARDIASANGSSPKWLVPVRQRDQTRQQVAQAQQQAAQAQALQQASGTLGSNLTKAPEKNSVLDQVMNNDGV